MGNESIMSRPDYQANMRIAMTNAKMLMRYWTFKLGGFGLVQIVEELQRCRHQVEMVRIEGAEMPGDELARLHQDLLKRLSLIEIATVKLLGSAYAELPDSGMVQLRPPAEPAAPAPNQPA